MAAQPRWLDENRHEFPQLTSNGDYDVVVVGGGITGLTTAARLKAAGKTVCVLERNRIGGGETGHTSAHLAAMQDLKLTEIANSFGKDVARLVWAAGVIAIDTIEAIVHQQSIHCGFQRIPGILHAAFGGTRDERSDLRNEAEFAQELHIDCQYRDNIVGLEKPGVVFADQARFHPVQYLDALAQSIPGAGCNVFENAEVESVEGEPPVVKVGNHSLRCGHVVLATHVPMMGKTGLIYATLMQSKIYPYSTYVVQGTAPAGRIPDALLWDTNDPYYYTRLIPGEAADTVIFGGADHKTGQVVETEKQFAQVESTLLDQFPFVDVTGRWSGQVIETNDGLPYIGETAKHQFAATGFSGNGLTFGTLAGLMACDWVLGRENPWQKLFSVDRKNLWAGTWDYLKENIDYPYYMVQQWLTEGRSKAADRLGPGEGQVILRDGHRIACACDDKGVCHEVSAVCTHMGCLVRWNKAEQTWDCPCHGSRFSMTGEVIGGPAEAPLEPVHSSNSS